MYSYKRIRAKNKCIFRLIPSTQSASITSAAVCYTCTTSVSQHQPVGAVSFFLVLTWPLPPLFCRFLASPPSAASSVAAKTQNLCTCTSTDLQKFYIEYHHINNDKDTAYVLLAINTTCRYCMTTELQPADKHAFDPHGCGLFFNARYIIAPDSTRFKKRNLRDQTIPSFRYIDFTSSVRFSSIHFFASS